MHTVFQTEKEEEGGMPKIIDDYWKEHDTHHEWVLGIDLEPNQRTHQISPAYCFTKGI